MPNEAKPFELIVSEDRAAVTLMVHEKAFLVMNAQELDTFLRQIGNARAQVLPGVPQAPDKNYGQAPSLRGMSEVVNTLDGVPLAPLAAGAGLLVRSELFGWQLQQLSPEDCRMLGEWLLGLRQDHPPPGAQLN